MYSSCKIWKKATDNASLLFHNTGPNLAQMLPLRTHKLSFFAYFQWNMLYFCNPVVLEKMVKPLKIDIFVPTLH